MHMAARDKQASLGTVFWLHVKKGGGGGHMATSTMPLPCSVVSKMMAILKYHASVHTVDLYGTPFSPDLLIFASYNH